MNFRSFEKTDRRILSIALLVLLLSSLLLWQDDWIYRVVQTRKLNLEQIGEVKSMSNDVRRRFEVALSWLPLRKKTGVFQGDSIFTGNDSAIVIETITGEQISIAPNSLVVINQKKDSISLNIGFGSVEGRIDKGKKLFITSNDSLTEIAGDNASIKVDAGEGNKIILNVLAGEVHVRTQDGEKLLRSSDTAELQQNGTYDDTTKPNIQLLMPLAQQKIKIHDDQPIVFSWQTKRKYSRMKIKIGTDSDLINTVVDTRVDDNTYSAYNLPKDTDLFWQIVAEGGLSKVQTFALVGDRPPIPIFPKPGYQFFFDPFLAPSLAGSTVDLSWEPGSPSSHYEIQLAADMTFLTNKVEHKTKDKKIKFDLLRAGQYYWRVRSIDFPDQAWSAPSMFKVGPVPTRMLAPPVPQLAESVFLIPTKIHGLTPEVIHSLRKRGAQKYIERYPRLIWSAVAGADRYVVEVSKNKQFTDVIVSETISRTNYTWRFVEPGTYFWRAKALSENFKDGLYTPTQEFKIALQAPVALSQTLNIDEVPDQILLNTPPPPLKLSWNSTVFTKAYEIEFSPTSDFKSPTRFISSQSSKQVQISKPGIYFWRIRSLDDSQLPASPFSAANTLEFQRVYKDPMKIGNLVAIYPKQQDSIILVGTSRSEIEFKWTKPYPGADYRIELSHEPNFQFVFYSTSTKNNYLKYAEMFQGRVVYWRVRAEKKDFVTDWTGANRFLVSYEGRPFDFEQSDLMFAARLKAKERQQTILAAQKRRLTQMRTPASRLELQLDTPQLIDPPEHFAMESNLDSNLSSRTLSTQPFDKFYEQIRNYPVIRWAKVPAAERYVVEIAKDKNFTQTISKTPVWNPFFIWDTARPGQFYYRIQAFNDRYKRSNFTSAQELRLTVTSPIATSQDTFVEVYDEPMEMWQPPNPFKLSWLPVIFARGYEVEFSEDKTFNLAKVYKTQDTSADLTVSRSGLYFWRVRPISENGIGIAPFSQVRSVEIIQTNRKPASANMLAGLFPIDRTMIFVGNGLMNLAFHWISPDSNLTSELELSDRADFGRIISKMKSAKGKAIVSSDLPEGKIYWRVRAGAALSSVNEFFLRREREPYSAEVKADITR